MNALASPALTPATCLQLDAYLHDTQHRLSPSEIANVAILEWLARPENLPARAVPESARGYQWKCLFLPESTRVRMYFKGECFHASVVGDALMFEGRRVSPRQMTLAVAGNGRNAWRELSLRFPGNPAWKMACVWRGEQQKNTRRAPSTPMEAIEAIEAMKAMKAMKAMDTMAAAAASMSSTLNAALQLVEHVNARTIAPPERRIAKHRRAEDLMVNASMLD